VAPHGELNYSSSLTLLIDRLEQIPALRHPSSLRLCLDLLRDNLGRSLAVDDYPTVRAQLIGIVQECRRQHALSAFIEVIEQVEPGSISVRLARAAFEDMTALDLVTEHERQELLSLLNENHNEKLTEFVRAAAGPAARLVGDDQYPEEALATLEQLNAGPDGLPPLLVFVEQLATAFGGPLAEQLRLWNDRLATRFGLIQQLQDTRHAPSIAPRGEHENTAYLVIRIERDHLDTTLYSVTHWQQNDPNAWRPRCGGTVMGGITAVKARVSALVNEAESGWARTAAAINIEFSLPFSLLNLPVDQWSFDIDSAIPRPLGLHYQVVVRSLDRARSPQWHREWRRRWETFKQVRYGNTDFEEHWLWSDGARRRQLTALDATLAVRKDVLALVLRSVPRSVEPGEVLVAIRTGVPIMLWCRTDSGRLAFENEVRDLQDVLPVLVEKLRLLRGKARREPRPNTHIGSRISLLWDDPERPVEPVDPPTAPVEEISA
jgi:vWA-MoxR associated protein C-terminal domain/vWA-MoxR associated protein middle region 0/Effector-associated domain 2